MDRETSDVVTIVVKSPYQNFPDQTLCCPTDWSVEQLKEEITQLCPSHPTVKEQKLIYWGKLLEDKVKLRETLKIYEEGQSNHTVHLVLKKDQSYVKGQEGLRKRNLASSSTSMPPTPSPASSSTQPLPSPDPRLFPSHMWGPAYFNPGTAYYNAAGTAYPSHPQDSTLGVQASQFGYDQGHLGQIMAMQQAYVQHMQQYMQLMMGGALPPGTPPPFMMQATPPPAVHQAGGGAEPNPNNPDLPAEERPRDWLDYFYLSSRALIFLTVVCFYSSPFRFLLVFVIGFAIYLYQSGFFRYPGPAILIGGDEPNPNQRPPAPPANETAGPSTTDPAHGENSPASPSSREHSPDLESAPSTIPAARDDSDAGHYASTMPTAREGPDATHSPSTIPAGRDSDQPTLLGLTWSIVANFFASLLPEQPGII